MNCKLLTYSFMTESAVVDCVLFDNFETMRFSMCLCKYLSSKLHTYGCITESAVLDCGLGENFELFHLSMIICKFVL
jgi:hypothetical protein